MEQILRKIFSASLKTAEKVPPACICSHCKKEIDTRGLYLRFTGELLHTDCLVEYMQRLNILDVIAPEKSGENAHE